MKNEQKKKERKQRKKEREEERQLKRDNSFWQLVLDTISFIKLFK